MENMPIIRPLLALLVSIAVLLVAYGQTATGFS
jgi:hypothetical protein